MTESHAARLAELIVEWRKRAEWLDQPCSDSGQDQAMRLRQCADALAALQAAPAEPETVLPSMHEFAAAPIERGETRNPYPDVAEPDRLQRAAWCGNSVYHDDYTPGQYDVRCKACLRALLAIRTLVADLVPRAVSVDDALSSPMAAGLVLQLKAECEAQHARAEAAEQQIAALTADRESIAEMLYDQEQANITLMALVETWTARAHAAEARIEELTAERNDV